MTYAGFLAVFLAPPIVLLGLLAKPAWKPYHRLACLLVCVLAFVYTAPWDNHAAADGLWTFDPRFAPHSHFLGSLPLEEYAFYLLQSVLICFGIAALSRVKRLWETDGP